MRKITQQAMDAFSECKNFKQGNTEVLVTGGFTQSGFTEQSVFGAKVQLKLHGNCIAYKENSELFICDCGYRINTTKERLNGLPGVQINQIKGVWYLNGDLMPFNQWIKI